MADGRPRILDLSGEPKHAIAPSESSEVEGEDEGSGGGEPGRDSFLASWQAMELADAWEWPRVRWDEEVAPERLDPLLV